MYNRFYFNHRYQNNLNYYTVLYMSDNSLKCIHIEMNNNIFSFTFICNIFIFNLKNKYKII